MSDLFSLGLSGLTAYRTALAAVGENVANAETPGFARRSVRLQAGIGDTVNADPIYREGYSFGGVNVTGVVRAWDDFRAAEARHANSDAGRTGVREQWFTAVESALGNGSTSVGGSITGLFNAADNLASAPADTLNRSRFVLALQDTAGAFRTTAGALQRTGAAVTSSAQLEVEKLNQAMSALGNINRSLLGALPGSTSRAALEDERDRLIDTVSTYVDVVTTIDDHGAARVDLADAPGSTLVATGSAATVSMAAAADGRISYQLATPGGTAAFTPSSGKLAGYVDSASAIADRRADLDALAENFAVDLNAWSAAGLDASGAAGTPLLSVTASAASMQALVTDGTKIPAASPSGPANGNLLALDALRANGGAEDRWTGIVAGHAQQLAAAKSENAAAKSWRETSYAVLDETSGIDLDREAADLLRYQQAYSASARIVQVGRETIDAILQLF